MTLKTEELCGKFSFAIIGKWINDQTSFQNIKNISNQPQTFEWYSLYKVYNECNLFLKEKYATLTHNNPEREKTNHIFGVSKIFDQE